MRFFGYLIVMILIHWFAKYRSKMLKFRILQKNAFKKVEKITVFSTFSSSACAHKALLSDQGLGITSGTVRSLGVDGRPLPSCTTNTLRAEKWRGNIPAI